MELWSADEAATRRKGNRVRRLASARALGRRHVSSLLYALAIAGVPAAVILLTGGPGTVGFWIVSLVWLATVVYGAVLTVFIGILVLSPLLLVIDRLVPGGTDSVVEKMSRAMVVVLAVTAFLVAAQLGDGAEVRLPVPSPNLGALMVISTAGAALYGLWSAADRLKPPKRQVVPRRHSVPEPDEEFWSHEYVVGWRSWNWDGSSLRGVCARWPSEVLEATCGLCDTVPSWNHSCGIYAAKTPAEVHVFYGRSSIVGMVEMWGELIEHEHGYRSSHARIIGLWVDDPFRAERIRAAYPAVAVRVGSPRVGLEVDH